MILSRKFIGVISLFPHKAYWILSGVDFCWGCLVLGRGFDGNLAENKYEGDLGQSFGNFGMVSKSFGELQA